MSDYTRIPLSQGKFALIDAEDAERVLAFKWSALCPARARRQPKWYAVRQDYSGPRQRMIYLHRFIMDAPHGVEVDHKDGNGLDCRRANLRLATRAQNSQNVRRRDTAASGYRGVYPTSRRRWIAEIVSCGKRFRSFGFRTAEDAARAYDALAIEHHGEFATLNFPPPARAAETEAA